jgi:hypothetical protein
MVGVGGGGSSSSSRTEKQERPVMGIWFIDLRG